MSLYIIVYHNQTMKHLAAVLQPLVPDSGASLARREGRGDAGQ